MDISLPLDKMSNLDKLAVMEKIWDDLCKNPDTVPSPEWHNDILETRSKHVSAGKAKFSSLDEARERIRDQIK